MCCGPLPVDDGRVNTTLPSGPTADATPATFPCPECGAVLATGTPVCGTCGIRLTGPLAVRLWQVDQQLKSLQGERTTLRRRLLAPPDADELARTQAWGPAPTQAPAGTAGGPGLPPLRAGTVPVSRGLTGQQVLLGLGALLLLSGVAFFLAVVWIVVGLVGQALIMVVLTALAAAGAVLATRKGLSAAAETSVVIASGFVVLDLTAAYGKGLLGLDAFSAEGYWSVAGWVGAGILVGFDRLVPSTVKGAPARAPFTYWPVASVLAVAAVTSLAFVVAPSGMGSVGLSLTALMLALAFVALALVALLLDVRSVRVVDRLTWSFLLPLTAAVVAALTYYLLALDAAYGVNPTGERYTGMVLLLAAPATCAAALVLRGRRAPSTVLLAAAGIGVLVALGVPLMDAPRLVVSLLAVPFAVALGVLALRGAAGRADSGLEWALRGVLVVLFAHGLLLELNGAETGVDLAAGNAGAGAAAWWVPALPAFLLAAAAGVSAVRHYAWLPAVVVHVAGFAALMTAVRDAQPMTWTVLWLLAATVSVVVAGVVHAVHHEATQARGYVRDDAARRRATDTGTLETLNLLAGAVHGVLAVVAATEVDARVTGTTLLLAGVMLLAYAVLPERLWIAYAGTAVVGLGNAVLLDDAGVGAVELYTVPVVLLLAVIGAVQAYRDREVRTMVTMGPALSVGLMPSLVVALDEGEFVRLLLVTLAALLAVLVGWQKRWQAPVALGSLVLAFVAVQQGGPLVEYVPGFVLLVTCGAVLLAIGVAWEHAVAAGRRGAAWFASLR